MAHVRVVELGEQARLGAEALEDLRLAGEVGAQRFERHDARELEVGCAEHLAHAAFADLLQDPVVADLLADHRAVPGAAQKGRLRLGYRKPDGGP